MCNLAIICLRILFISFLISPLSLCAFFDWGKNFRLAMLNSGISEFEESFSSDFGIAVRICMTRCFITIMLGLLRLPKFMALFDVLILRWFLQC